MSDPIRKVQIMRTLYNAGSKLNLNLADELNEIKTELKIANELSADAAEAQSSVNSATGLTSSPYLQDQKFHLKEVLYNSPKEADWKEVRSEEDNRRAAYNARNLRKLNIL